MSHRTYFAHSRGFYFDSVISERLARCPVHRPSPEGVQKLWIRARDRVRSEISQLGFPATRVVAACVTVSAAATATATAATGTAAGARSHIRNLTFAASSPFHVHVSTRVCKSSAAVHRCNIEELLRRIIATDEFGRVVLCSVLLLQLIACVMPGSRSSTDPEHKSPRESGEDSEDESEILEESPCGRWLKRREEVYVGSKSTLAEGSTFGAARGSENEVTEMEVEQRDVPGIDCAYLAMDTEEGVEVVWNEVQFSERKNFKAQEEKIQLVFENLTQLEHPNIVKFHRYWTDTHNDKPRVIFITEYMSSGSLKQFLKRTKRNVKKLPLQAWKRWCTQILSALSYLHSCSPPIIHGNLTCDTIFIQHNGLVKIGSVAPDAIHHHVKTCRANMKNMHFVAPEYGNSVTPAIDIYSFGMCALEMAALEIQGNGDSGTIVTEENVRKTIESLDDVQQKDFIRKCLHVDPLSRPSARELLFHPVLFEVHSLKLLAAHALVNSATNISETITDEVLQRLYGPDTVVAEIKYQGRPPQQIRLSDIPVTEKLEKFVEDVKYGIYPLTAFMAKLPPPVRPRAISPEVTESVKSVTPEPVDVESRRVVNMMCNVKPREESCELLMTILLRMDDKMNRQLTCPVSQVDTSLLLAQELVHFGFINENDRDKIANLIEEALRSCFNKQMMTPGMVSLTNLPTQTTLLLPGPEFPCLQHFDNSMYNASTSNSDSVTNPLPKTSGLPVSSNTSKSHDEAEPPTNTESGS